MALSVLSRGTTRSHNSAFAHVLAMSDMPLAFPDNRQHIGTTDDNGVENGAERMKLTEEQVVAIRMRYLDGATQQEIAEQFHIGQSAVSKVITRMAYGRVPEPMDVKGRGCTDCHAQVFGKEKRCEKCRKIHQQSYYKQYRRKRKAASKPPEEWKCVDCKIQVEGGMRRCEKCNTYHQDTYFIRRYRRLKAERLAKQSEVSA